MNNSKKADLSAFGGAAGGGTVLINMINSLGLDPEIQNLLLSLTPWVSLFTALVIRYLLRKLQLIQIEKDFDRKLEKARIHLDKALVDSILDTEQKEEVRNWYYSILQQRQKFIQDMINETKQTNFWEIDRKMKH